MLIYPLIFKLSCVTLVTPPAINNSKAFLTVSIPKIYGAIESAKRLNNLTSSSLDLIIAI
jgi:hypothetical protein